MDWNLDDPSDPDVRWMRLAIEEAARGRGFVEPNPMVGAVVVRDGALVAVGRHERFGGPHAEAAALKAAGEAARGATLYVSLEPCRHHGKTPPCTDAILRAGVARVVAAHRDPFPKVDGGGIALLRDAGLDVRVGVGGEAAASLNAPFLKRVFTGLPYVVAKWAMTLDGKTATASGDSRWISSSASRALVHEVRGRMDAIVVGAATATVDDPLLTARPPGPRTPVRIVLDSSARLGLGSQLVRTAREVPILVATASPARGEAVGRLRDAGCEVLEFPGESRVPILGLLEELGRRGMTNVLVEGGGVVLGSFLDAGQVDEVDVYLAPVVEGGDHARTPVRGRGVGLMSEALRLRNVGRTLVGEDVRVQGETLMTWRERLGGSHGPTMTGEPNPT